MLEPKVLEKFEETLEEVRRLSEEDGIPIIVEGKKDEMALRELGIKGPIHQIPTGGKTALNSLEDLPEYDKIIVLTDFDRTGEELAEFCERHLQKLGIKVLIKFRKKLRSYVRKGVKDIEGMKTFIESERSSKSKCNSKFGRSPQSRG